MKIPRGGSRVEKSFLPSFLPPKHFVNKPLFSPPQPLYSYFFLLFPPPLLFIDKRLFLPACRTNQDQAKLYETLVFARSGKIFISELSSFDANPADVGPESGFAFHGMASGRRNVHLMRERKVPRGVGRIRRGLSTVPEQEIVPRERKILCPLFTLQGAL